MRVIARMDGQEFPLDELAAADFDAIADELKTMEGLPFYWREGSNPPDVWPRPASNVAVEVRE